MIQRIFGYYDDSQYYIASNKKKLAHDNLSVIDWMLTFFVFVSMFFVLSAMVLGDKQLPYYLIIPPIIVLIVIIGVNKLISKKCTFTFEQTRIYAAIIYSIIIINFSYADIVIYNKSRAVFFPAAIFVLSAVYNDYMAIMFLYKLILTVIFIAIDLYFKSTYFVLSDFAAASLAIIASTICYAVNVSSNVSRKVEHIELEEKSQKDLLTGLLNKVSFEEKCEEYLQKKMDGAKCTMFIFDLDNFKGINDKYGHGIGDKVLKLVADTLQSYFHPDDLIGRIGGDEFMVLVLGEMPDGFAQRRCRSILHELKVSKVDKVAGFSCSIGIVQASQRTSFKELYGRADKALYRSKEEGKARYTFVELDKKVN